jgi:capsid portal protein
MNDDNGHPTLEAAIVKEGDPNVELHAIEAAPGMGSTTQPPTAEWELWTPDDTIPPPEDLELLARLTDYSAIRETCLSALTRNTVGLGWDVDVWPGHEASDEEVTEARSALDVLARRDKVFDRPSLSTLLELVVWDREECGNGAFEVSRNRNTGQIDGIYHAPGAKVRRRQDRSGYVIGQNPALVDNASRRDFYNFGEKVNYDSKGNPQRTLQSGKKWAINELVVLRRYTSASRDYGLPRDLGLVLEYAAMRFLAEWTASFFEGSGSPARIIFVAGAESKDGKRTHFTVPQATVNRIQQAMKSDAKPGSRVALIPVPPGTTVQDVTLGELSDRDLTFTEFRKNHRANVRSAMGPLSPIFVGDVDDSGRYTAEVQRAITLEQVFDPEQRTYEDKLWTTLMTDKGYDDLRIKFKRLAVEGDAVKREGAIAMSEAGTITVGEFRAAHGYGPLDEDTYGEGANEELVNQEKPKGAEDRVAVEATQDQRGLRPGIGGRVAKHDHGVPHVESALSSLDTELLELIEG